MWVAAAHLIHLTIRALQQCQQVCKQASLLAVLLIVLKKNVWKILSFDPFFSDLQPARRLHSVVPGSELSKLSLELSYI